MKNCICSRQDMAPKDLLSIGMCIPSSFKIVCMMGRALRNRLAFGQKNGPSITLGSSMRAERYFLMNTQTSLLCETLAASTSCCKIWMISASPRYSNSSILGTERLFFSSMLLSMSLVMNPTAQNGLWSGWAKENTSNALQQILSRSSIFLALSMVTLKFGCTTLMSYQMKLFGALWIKKRFVTTLVLPVLSI